MVPMPSMIDTFIFEVVFDTTLIIVSKEICFKTYQACLAIIRENSILWLALHCVMGPESYNSFIFQKALRCLQIVYFRVFMGVNLFLNIRHGPVIYSILK